MEDTCITCTYVSRDECKGHRDTFQCSLEEHEKRLNETDVDKAKMATQLGMTNKILWAIFGVIVVAVVGNLINILTQGLSV